MIAQHETSAHFLCTDAFSLSMDKQHNDDEKVKKLCWFCMDIFLLITVILYVNCL